LTGTDQDVIQAAFMAFMVFMACVTGGRSPMATAGM
jgi:hypothetical protein